MFTIFCLFTISIGSLTLFALKSKSPNSAELKITLSFTSANFKSLLGNFKTLFLLLLKDLFQNPAKSTVIEIKTKIDTDKEFSNDQINNDTFKPDKTSSEDSNEDYILSEFSPEVIDLIEEEEQKAA